MINEEKKKEKDEEIIYFYFNDDDHRFFFPRVFYAFCAALYRETIWFWNDYV